MRIVVCIKQVPSSGDVTVDPVTHNLVREKAGSMLNPSDYNAIEAAQGSRRKWMKLVLRADRGVFLIHIANSCAGPPKRKAGRFLSTKENAVEHGIGLQNVKRMVEKQNGNIEFQYEDGIFLVEVMLYMNEM